ncbi:hypothetical protein NR798_27700 [Archangium gephyra]|uniref:hypothetical protein n=1 Tax=Archangium gephyra TaxID=48 RepID=UPI0035D528F0
MAPPPGWPDLSARDEELLAPLLGCSPAEFVLVQQRVDMPRLMEALAEKIAVEEARREVPGVEVLSQ